MKKTIVSFVIVLWGLFSCNTDDLVLINPNSPSEGSLETEDGIKAFALGVLEKAFGASNNLEGGNSAFFMALGHHNIMGDDIYIPWGNWGWRWSAIYTKIRINATGTEYKHTLYPDISQQAFMQANNSRAAGEVNSFKYEWIGAYWTIGQCNLLLKNLEKDISFSGDADIKKKTLQAWAYWWKGFMYSRVGSMYLAGLIVDDFGTTNPNYVSREEVIAEATKNFDLAAGILTSLSVTDDYTEIMKAVVMSFNQNNAVVTPEMWIRAINTYKARNILVNKKVADMSSTDWNNVITLANQGLLASDNIFTLGMSADGNNDLAAGFYHPNWVCNTGQGWWFVSERLIQEFDPADDRLSRNFEFMTDLNDWQVNVRNRGWNFGTRYLYTDVENGGTYATANGQGQWPISPTYEETQLMLAEAKLRTNDLTGLQHVDNVRDFQDAGLAAVNGTGLSQSDALEVLRRERRVALALRGLSFYDARRWGIIAPEANGGGRSNAMVLIPSNVYDPETDGEPGVYPCFIEYNYMDYWDIPADELDFNVPADANIKVKN